MAKRIAAQQRLSLIVERSKPGVIRPTKETTPGQDWRPRGIQLSILSTLSEGLKMFYRRFWARGEIRSTDGFRVIPMGERGIIYYDKSGRYFIDAAVTMHRNPVQITYEVSPEDVFATTPANRSGDPSVAVSLQKRKEVLRRVGEAVRYSGAGWLER